MEMAQRASHWTKRFCDSASWPQVARAFDTLIEPMSPDAWVAREWAPTPENFAAWGPPIPEEMQL